MASVAQTIASHVTKTPGVRGGKACIDDTRVAVADIVQLLRQGQSPRQMLEVYPRLSLAQVHSALSYYYDHHEEIDAIFEADEAAAADFDRRKAELQGRHRA